MTTMRYLYLFAAVAAVVLAATAPYWIPPNWVSRPIRKHATPNHGGSFPFYEEEHKQKQKEKEQQEAAAATNVVIPDRKSSNNNGKKQKEGADVTKFPFDLATVRVLTKDEVAQHNGADENKDKPLYLVVLGEVYDVTTGARFYSPGSGYNCFVGKDNSAAFHTGKFNDTLEDVRGLPATAVQSIVGWRSFFRNHETYEFVGVLGGGVYFDKDGKPTEALNAVHALAGNAKTGEEEDKRRAKLFPRCNMHYDGLKKVTTVWCDGYQHESDLAKMKSDKDLRVLRMVAFTSQASGERQQDCRCLRLEGGEAEIGSSPFPTAKVDYYFLEKGCPKDSPRCFMKVE